MNQTFHSFPDGLFNWYVSQMILLIFINHIQTSSVIIQANNIFYQATSWSSMTTSIILTVHQQRTICLPKIKVYIFNWFLAVNPHLIPAYQQSAMHSFHIYMHAIDKYYAYRSFKLASANQIITHVLKSFPCHAHATYILFITLISFQKRTSDSSYHLN